MLLLSFLQPEPAESKQFAYVTTQSRNTVVAIDTDTDAVVEEIPLSIGSSDVAVTPDGAAAYVVNPYTDSLTVIDLHSYTVVDHIPVGRQLPVGGQPGRIAITSDGRRAYVTGQPTVEVDLSTGLATPVLDVPLVFDVATSKDGRFVYFAVYGLDVGLLILDTATHQLTGAAPGYWGVAVALSPAERVIYLTGNRATRDEDRLVAIDALSLAEIFEVGVNEGRSYAAHLERIVTTRDGSALYIGSNLGWLYSANAATGETQEMMLVPVPLRALAFARNGEELYVRGDPPDTITVFNTSTNAAIANLPVGTEPQGIAPSPDGKLVYVAAADGFYAIDTATKRIVATVPSGTDPTGIAATPDGRGLYVANQSSGSVAVVDTEQLVITKSIQTGGHPLGIVLTPDGRSAYVTSFQNPGIVFVIDTATNTVTGTIEVPGHGGGIAITPDGRRVFVSNYDWWTISTIDTQTNTVLSRFRVSDAPKGIAISHDGGTGVVAAGWSVQFFDPASLSPEVSPVPVHIVGSAGVADSACGIVLNSTGSRAYVTDDSGDSAFLLDTVARAQVAAIPIAVPYFPDSCGVVLTPDERRIYAANTGNGMVTVMDADDLHVIHHIPVLPAPFSLAIACPGGCPSPSPTLTPSATSPATPTPTPALPPLCYGDCNRDGVVTIDEIIAGTDFILGGPPRAECAFDRNLDGIVTIDELLLAIASALNGCHPLPTMP